ncbi:YhgE/Pip domain-containing protein [Gleimia europaea]|uniref:YhgE/Pip domain-containing protein n=1 Tax=Gleimia europaea TaxID=66228 RepID=UPI002659E41F|nr:YhgE/Pip domain-containing protein [Gleimia europaea]MDK7143150.1 YhgE/Pip domain-containing protein [Gleimia europaea]
MKQIFFIARDDLRQINSSVMAKIFVVILISVPLFFTWFNVLATWDPFSNSDRLQIAVASTDKGYNSEVLRMNVNVGDIVMKELATNDQLDWILTSEDRALEGTRSGEYYAAIVLPDDFSTSMFTFYAGGAKPANITLYTNEKKNPLSANLTTQGAQGVTAQINTTFSQALAEVAVGMAEDVSAYLDDAQTQATLDRLGNRLESLAAQLNAGADTVDSLSALIGSTIPLATGTHDLAAGIQESFDEATGTSFDSSSGMADPFAGLSAGLSESLNQASSNIEKVESRLDTLLNSADETAQSSADAVDQLRAMLDKQIDGFKQTRDKLAQVLGPDGDDLLADLDTAIARQQSLSDRLGQISKDLRAGRSSDSDSKEAARKAIEEAAGAISAAHDSFSKNLQPQIDSLRSNLESAGENAAVFRSYMQAVQSDLSESAGGLIAGMDRAAQSLSKTAQSMRESVKRLNEANKQVREANSGADTSQIAKALGADPQGFARLLSSPVAVDRTPVFPVASFGVGMAPLFTVIALWVGALLAGVFLRTDVSKNVGKRYLESVESSDADDSDDDAEAKEELKDSGELEEPENAEEVRDDESVDDNEAADRTQASDSSDDKVRKTAKHARKPAFTGAQEYLGRYVMFWLIGMAQSTLLMGGLIVIVEIEPAHPFLLMLAGWVISTVFTNIVYTLVISLSNAGKAIAVVLLVLQISAAGGAYPLELLPQWFQNISPWLPATYAINLMRSAVAGIYAGDFVQNLAMILLFIIPNLLIGLVFRHAIAGNIEKMTKEVEKTKVM